MASDNESNNSFNLSQLDEIEHYLRTKIFPTRCVGNRGLKANFRRQSRRFLVEDDVLYYRHSLRRTNSQGIKHVVLGLLVYFVIIFNDVYL